MLHQTKSAALAVMKDPITDSRSVGVNRPNRTAHGSIINTKELQHQQQRKELKTSSNKRIDQLVKIDNILSISKWRQQQLTEASTC